MNLSVVILLNDLAVGGSERQALRLAAALQARGARVTVAGLAGPGPLEAVCRERGVACRSCALRYPLSPFYAPFNLVRARRFLEALRPDVILGYTGVPNVYGALTWREAGARRFVWNQRSAGLYRMPRLLERAAVRRTPAFTANAQSGVDFLTRTLGVPAERIALVHNGVEPAPAAERRGAWRARLEAGSAALLACMVGNVRPPKDHAGLLAAWAHVAERFRRSAAKPLLVLAGSLPPEAAALREAAAAPALEGSVRFLGFQEDVYGLLADMDLGVFASRSEGMPNGVLECMAAGLPVAATDLPGIRECLGAEQVPYLAPVGDVRALAENIICLLRDPAERRRLGALNRTRIERDFTVDKMVARMTDVLLPDEHPAH
ncbi:MAG: glycosyltransferase [Lentisphaerae bacterium]|nr:glycosyltransferase [Lentisphaerota bacterium]